MRARIAEIAKIRPGYLARQGVTATPEGTHRLLQIRDFNPERTAFDPASLARFLPDSPTSVQPLSEADVIFLAKGANNFAFATGPLPEPTLAAGYFFVIRPRAEILPAYLAWFLNQPATLRTISRLGTSGAHMPVVRRADIESIEVPVPPVDVQHAIVELDSLAREEQTLLRELMRCRSALVSESCMAAARSGVEEETIDE